MKLSEYFNRIEIIKKEINGCNGLINYYMNKKGILENELEALLNKEIKESEQE